MGVSRDEYQMLDQHVVDLNPSGQNCPRFFEVRVMHATVKTRVAPNQPSQAVGESLRVEYGPVGSREIGVGRNYFGAAVKFGGLQEMYLRLRLTPPDFEGDSAWLSVEDPEYTGLRGDIILDEWLRGTGLGTHLMNEVVKWLRNSHEDAYTWPIGLSEVDAKDGNLERRNQFYKNFGLHLEFADEEGRCGHSTIERCSTLKTHSSSRVKVLSMPQYEALAAQMEQERIAQTQQPKKTKLQSLMDFCGLH